MAIWSWWPKGSANARWPETSPVTGAACHVSNANMKAAALLLALATARDQFWPLVVEGIRQSGVAPGRIVLCVVDEPALRAIGPWPNRPRP